MFRNKTKTGQSNQKAKKRKIRFVPGNLIWPQFLQLKKIRVKEWVYKVTLVSLKISCSMQLWRSKTFPKTWSYPSTG